VQKEVTQSAVTFWLVNQQPYVFTGTLVINTQNLQSQGLSQDQYTITQVVKGHQKIKVLALRAIDLNQDTQYQEQFYWAPGSIEAKHQANQVYQYPYPKQQTFPIVQGFGGSYSHQGASKYAVDFAMPLGTPIHAARAGVVIDLAQHHNQGGASRRYAKYANYVVILHDDDTTGEYYHLRQNGVGVARGQKVEAGQALGYSGNTGFSSLPHLHFAVYKALSHGGYQSLPFKFVGQ
jgi:murein DD-endopeptidase MepM/ murein hydrolase activator NlpD